MTDASDPGTIRSVLLEVIDNLVSEHDNLQAAGIIQRASRKLPRPQDMQAERLVLEVRDALVARLQALNQTVPPGLTDWRIKRVLSTLEATVATRKVSMSPALFERFEANWPAITHQIRTARNEAGHPVSVEPGTPQRG